MIQSLSDKFITIRAAKGDVVAKNNLILRNKEETLEYLIVGLSMALQLQHNLILTSSNDSFGLIELHNNVKNIIRGSLKELFELYNSDRPNLEKFMSSLKYENLHCFDEGTYYYYKQTKDLNIELDFARISEILTNIKFPNLLSMFTLLIINTIIHENQNKLENKTSDKTES